LLVLVEFEFDGIQTVTLPNLSDYFIPEQQSELIELLQRFGENAMIVAGGTFVHGLEARGLLSEVKALIDIGRLGLNGIATDSSGVILGATTTLADLMQADFVQNAPAFGALEDALGYPPVQIRNVGTVGGCLAASAPLYDVPATLLALDGTAQAMGLNGAREIALTDFFTGLFENALQPDEFITELRLPAQAAGTASAFLKLETNANDLAIINVAVRFTLDEAGFCQDSRIVIGGGVGETYVRARSAESELNGTKPDADLFKVTSMAVATDIDPVTDHRGSGEYRRHMAIVYTRRALGHALERLS
jgi:carbon-monoxide dehydrogenase medium subunit